MGKNKGATPAAAPAATDVRIFNSSGNFYNCLENIFVTHNYKRKYFPRSKNSEK